MTSHKNAANRQNQASVNKDKNLGWIPNPRNDMSRFYNEVYESFYLERVGYFGGNKKAFKKAFHEEARREYDNEKAVKKIREQLAQLKSVKDPSKAGFLLRENHILKPHDSTTITQNMLHIKRVETSIETLQKNLKEHLERTIHSSGRVLTGHKTAHDFDEQKLTELQGFRNELHTLITSLSQLQETCKAAFKHPFSAMKRKSRKRKQNTQKSVKRKKARHVARTTEVLKKIAPDWSEGKICEKEDLCGDIVKELGKREQKWAVALMFDQCELLNDSAQSELRTMLGFSESESSSNASDGDESSDQDNLSSINDSKDSERNSDDGADDSDVTEQCQEEDSGSVFTAVEAYDSSSAEDIGPYWNTMECTPYYEPIE